MAESHVIDIIGNKHFKVNRETQECKKFVFAGGEGVQKHTFCTPELISDNVYLPYQTLSEITVFETTP